MVRMLAGDPASRPSVPEEWAAYWRGIRPGEAVVGWMAHDSRNAATYSRRSRSREAKVIPPRPAGRCRSYGMVDGTQSSRAPNTLNSSDPNWFSEWSVPLVGDPAALRT